MEDAGGLPLALKSALTAAVTSPALAEGPNDGGNGLFSALAAMAAAAAEIIAA